MTSTVTIYTCSTANKDWILKPSKDVQASKFLRYSDVRARAKPWCHRQLSGDTQLKCPRLIARYHKTQPPAEVLETDVSVWVDSSIKILSDISALVHEFMESGADIGLFRHPSGRTVREEIEFCTSKGMISDLETAASQLRRYDAQNISDELIFETPIVFRRNKTPGSSELNSFWWDEIKNFTIRDQVSLNYALAQSKSMAYIWDWHFDEANAFFRRIPHRPKAFVKRLKTGAHFLAESQLDYRLLNIAIRGVSLIKNGRRKGR